MSFFTWWKEPPYLTDSELDDLRRRAFVTNQTTPADARRLIEEVERLREECDSMTAQLAEDER